MIWILLYRFSEATPKLSLPEGVARPRYCAESRRISEIMSLSSSASRSVSWASSNLRGERDAKLPPSTSVDNYISEATVTIPS